MKVAIVTNFPADPGRPSGGVQSVGVNLVEYLARTSDAEWHVVTQDAGVSAPARGTWKGAEIHRLPLPKGSNLRNAVGAGRRQISAYLEGLRPDLIHSHDTYGMMVKGARLNAPRVFTVHGFIHKDTLVSGRKLPWLRSQLWKPFEVAGWADQDHIISISPYVREFVTGRTRAIIHDIDNPIREDFFRVERREVPGRIFCAAEISPRKNTLALIQAFDRLVSRGVEAELRLAGKVAHEGYGRQVENFIAQRSLGDKVRRLGLIRYEQVREELATAAIFALISLEENSPMGIEEAMAVGIPVVTSNRCGMPYMIREGESGFLVDPHDVEDVATRLEDLIQNDDLRARMSACSKQIAAERFHPAVVAARTLEVYRRAMGRRAAQ